MSPLQQTDKRLEAEPSIKPFGCFAVSLREIAEHYVGRVLSASKNLKWYRWCVADGVLLDEEGKRAYVMDHAAVINAALYYLGAPQTARYVGAEYFDGRPPWGDMSKANYFISQGEFEGFQHSHFYESNRDGLKTWDPYWPHAAQYDIVSIRGFAL